jgi:dUTP pyrophosphatase
MFDLRHPDAVVPIRATSGAAGFDLSACHDDRIVPGDWRVINTGVSVNIPAGHYAMVCSRSGMAAKFCVFVANAPGIIDSDYKDEVKVILKNAGNRPFEIKVGDRIAQLVFAQCDTAIYTPVTMDSERKGGLGSTGR